MPEESNSQDDLKQQRSTIKGSITRIKNLIETKGSSLSAAELECRLGILDSYFKQALTIQTKIEKSTPSDGSRSELEEMYIGLRTKIISLIGPDRRRASTTDVSFMVSPPINHLPKLQLPRFSGKYSDYKNFINRFTNLVDQDSSLTKIEKFNHLLTCLTDQALGTVRAFQVTEENYPKALSRLKERYDNDCLIFQENISALFELPKVPKASAPQLRNLIDNISALYNSLSSLGSENDICNALIIYMAMSKMDSETQSRWEEQLDYKKLPTWEECASVLGNRCRYLEARESKEVRWEPAHKQFSKQKPFNGNHRTHTSLTATQRSCIFCKDLAHAITTCSSFINLSGTTYRVVHRALDANGVTSITIRFHRVQQPEANQPAPSGETSSVAVHMASGKHSITSTDQVILAIALVLVRDSSGIYQIGRVLLDSGSQVNLIRNKFATDLKLKKWRKEVDIVGVGAGETRISSQTQTTIRSRFNNFEMLLECLVTPVITGYQPDSTLNISNWNLPKNIELADEHFNEPSQIDLLLGAEAFFDLLCVGQIRLREDLPSLQKTLLGWIVSGKFKSSSNPKKENCLLGLADDSLSEYVERFWQLEEVSGKKLQLTDEQTQCEQHFVRHVEESEDGRLMVKLPFKENPSYLGTSYDIAHRRFLALERRLSKNSSLKLEYSRFLKEYEALGHMTPVQNPKVSMPHYYLPHQCVIRPESQSTKLRVVFDASCYTSSQLSLNNILMVGPTIQDELLIILLRFRLHRYALTADIVKMYRQVLVHPDHRRFQRILWRDEEQSAIQTYELNTVTYGTSSAPFLAIRCLRYLSEKWAGTHKLGSQVLNGDFYVDDMLTGADDIETLQQIQEEVVSILSSAGFELSKWHSNATAMDDRDGQYSHGGKNLKLSDSAVTSTLGITWDSLNDNFHFSYRSNQSYSHYTKRSILSLSSSLFDPMGLLSPIIIKAKVILQKLWVEKLNWDESIPQVLDTEWRQFVVDLQSLKDLSVPRFALINNKQDIQIHGFSDASLEAYGCCIYVRSTNSLGHSSVNLLVAKSRVSPARKKQIPRLELCGAHLLTKLWSKIKSIFKDSISKVYFWTDSEIVLHWIQTHTSKLTTFVGNRVAEIQEKCVGVEWRHVRTLDNPADIVSRGCSVAKLAESIWFNGPRFLLESSEKWPSNDSFQLSSEQLSLEKRKTVLLCKKGDYTYLLDIIDRYSSYKKLLRIFAYVLRFYNHTKHSGSSDFPTSLSTKELDEALIHIVFVIQQHSFAEEITAITNGQSLKGSIKWLNPFLENKNGIPLLRVGGRLHNSSIPEERKHPLLLPKKVGFTKILVRHLHLSNYHAGAKALIALIRDTFWIVNARDIARKTVRDCIHCVRYRPKLLQQIMGNLPTERLTVARPFTCCGVDFCGPILTYYKIRGKVPYKTYIAVFVCFASKAVHLEAVSDLSADAFIASLKRFVGRRGLPKDIYCDNGTNFVGAHSKLKEFKNMFFHKTSKELINNFCINENLNFHFIPPRAPHFGGIWEVAVKTAKVHLLRSFATAKMRFEELSTALVDIEAIMNSRPLTPLSSDPNDLEALTPGHFLIGAPLRSIPEAGVDVADISFLQRWRRITAVKTHFWQRWSNEYINELQGRTKWSSVQENLPINSLVIIHEDNVPSQKWLLGRVVKTITGADGKVRVADVRTSKGTLRRPICKLAILTS